MHVIGAGFGRTGTLSLKAALERLGCAPCLHMVELLREPGLAAPWNRRLAGEAVDWQEELAGFGATVDWPGCHYVAELAAAFPDAPVLLTTRDPERWFASVRETLWAAHEAYVSGGADGPINTPTRDMIERMLWQETFGPRCEHDAAIAAMTAHNDRVRAEIAPERLVEHEIADGWAPLAAMLGVPVPDEPFPHLNDTDAFRAMTGLGPRAA